MKNEYPKLFTLIKDYKQILYRDNKDRIKPFTTPVFINVANNSNIHAIDFLIRNLKNEITKKLYNYCFEEIIKLTLEAVKDACNVKGVIYNEEDFRKDLILSNDYLFKENRLLNPISSYDTLEIVYNLYNNTSFKMADMRSFILPLSDIMYFSKISPYRYEIYNLASTIYQEKINKF